MEKLQVIKHPQFGSLSVMIIDGKEMFKANECAAMLGYAQPKDAISRHCKGAIFHRLPTKSGEQNVKFIPEGDVWRLIIRSKLPQAEEIEKWIMDEVLPAIRKTGTYTMKQEAKPDKPYEYIEKTYNGVPVLTSADVEYFTKIRYSTIDWYFRFKCVKDSDYYYITGDELKKYKIEDPRVSRLSSVLYLITREGFIKFCRAYGIKIETPKCFEDKVETKYIPHKSMLSLLGYIDRDIILIEEYKNRLLKSTSKNEAEFNRTQLVKAIRSLKGYSLEAQAIIV